MPDILTLQDLRNRMSADRVIQYFDDDKDGVVAEGDLAVVAILEEAEGEAFNPMLRAYGTKDAIVTLAENDPVFKGHIAWVACELASERHNEFNSSDGSGAYMTQYDRAIKYFDTLSKGRVRSIGEVAAGRNGNVGGNLQPAPPAGTSGAFTFAPSVKAPSGHGGY